MDIKTNNGRNMQVAVYGGSLGLLGKNYELIRIQFHRPSEMTVDGRSFDMDAQLLLAGIVSQLILFMA